LIAAASSEVTKAGGNAGFFIVREVFRMLRTPAPFRTPA
jgi:hypothetical protein